MLNPCSLCDANCCKTYTLTATAFDILRIMEATGRKPEEFATLHPARLLSFDPDMTLDMEGDNWAYLLGLKSHPCVFLSKNQCPIHSAAPLSCRRYPFQFGGKLNTRFCPLPSQLVFRVKGPDIGTAGMREELRLHRELVAEWNKKPGKKSQCIAFLLGRAEKITCSGGVWQSPPRPRPAGTSHKTGLSQRIRPEQAGRPPRPPPP